VQDTRPAKCIDTIQEMKNLVEDDVAQEIIYTKLE
jgi:hypothetical protein